jgi:hypothetical protein
VDEGCRSPDAVTRARLVDVLCWQRRRKPPTPYAVAGLVGIGCNHWPAPKETVCSMKRIALAALGVIGIATSAWGQTPPAKPDEKTLADAITRDRLRVSLRVPGLLTDDGKIMGAGATHATLASHKSSVNSQRR